MSEEIQSSCQTLEFTSSGKCYKATLAMIQAPLSRLVEQHNEYLHAEELAVFKDLKYEKRQHSYLLGRYVAKLALKHTFIGQDLGRVFVAPGIFNFPVVYGLQEKIQISLAHSEHFSAALVFPEAYPMGIDLEIEDAVNGEVIHSHLTKHEKLLYTNELNIDTTRFVFVLWTAKEALGKVLKTGLTTPLNILEIKSIKVVRNGFQCLFTNFPQYQAFTCINQPVVVSMVYSHTAFLTDLHL
ncbi:MAG: 4'-phosphopantetheinyl transferase superfamily protein [Chlamydiales bacterium]|nr:4'-phosphopantetheinyl transferase superfamily protein [Chlamydiales bacterium]